MSDTGRRTPEIISSNALIPGGEVKDAKPKFAIDEQTGKSFEIEPETLYATVIASLSAVYLISALAFLLWLLFDTWTGRDLLLESLGYGKTRLAAVSFRLFAFVAIGGAIGGVVDGIRSNIAWHSERKAYGPRFIWKDLSLPLTGAAVGLLVYATLRTGAGAVSGDFSLDQKGGAPTVIAFAAASLAGFSAQQVFRWLDAQANKLFRVTDGAQTVVPDLSGKTADEAEALLKTWKLTLGLTNEETAAANIGKIVKQSPGPGAVVADGKAVDITVGTAD